MKAIVLAGGYAKRLWPLTKNMPKPLLDIAGKPMIDYIMEQLVEIKEIEKIYISTNDRFKENFQRWLKERNYRDTEIVIEPTHSEEEKFGAIKGLAFVIEQKKINDDVLIVAGDNLFEFKLKDFVDFFKKKQAPVIAIYDLKDYELAKQMAVVSVDKDVITEFVEKPEKPKSTLIAICCYLLPKNTINLISKYLEEGNNPDSPGYFISWLVKRTACFAFKIEGKWFDIGTFESLEKARKYFANKSKK